VKDAQFGLILACAVALGFCEKLSAEEPARPTTTATPAAVKLQTESYEKIYKTVSGHKGKIVVMDCWSTWCLPCQKEFPGLVKLHQQYPKQVVCVSLSFDNEGRKLEATQKRVLEFLSSQKATFDNYLSTDMPEDMYDKLKLSSIPAILIFDQEGRIAHRLEGETQANYENVGRIVKGMLGQTTK